MFLWAPQQSLKLLHSKYKSEQTQSAPLFKMRKWKTNEAIFKLEPTRYTLFVFAKYQHTFCISHRISITNVIRVRLRGERVIFPQRWDNTVSLDHSILKQQRVKLHSVETAVNFYSEKKSFKLFHQLLYCVFFFFKYFTITVKCLTRDF